jgi:hypothetical protein
VNPNPNKSLVWAIDTKNLDEEKIFQITPNCGEIKGG